MSKNNPENRGEVTELRKYNGKTVKPVRYVNRRKKMNYIAAMFDSGELVVDKGTGLPIPYSMVA